jgi:hypothetical protein
MKQVVLIFSDKFMTQFMQHADMFEPFKVVVKEPVYASVVDDWGNSHIEAIKRQCADGNYDLIAAVGEEVYYSNPAVRVVSNGQGWAMLEEYLAHLKEVEKGRKWSVGFGEVMASACS